MPQDVKPVAKPVQLKKLAAPPRAINRVDQLRELKDRIANKPQTNVVTFDNLIDIGDTSAIVPTVAPTQQIDINELLDISSS